MANEAPRAAMRAACVGAAPRGRSDTRRVAVHAQLMFKCVIFKLFFVPPPSKSLGKYLLRGGGGGGGG